jgi:phosphatidylinositol alpha 1,6-mannosyltransferase
MDRLAIGVSYTACFPAVTTEPMRIALFSEVYWPMVSGVAVTLRRLTDSLTARGHEVRVYSATYPLPPGGRDRPEARRSASLPLFLYPDVQWAFPRFGGLLEDVGQFRPDVVHVATEFSMGLAGAKIARRLGRPLIASAHTNYEQYAGRYGMEWVLRPGWRYLRWFYGQADMVLCPSRFYQDYLEARGIGHTALWTRGVDTDTFSPRHRDESWRSTLGLAPHDLLVTYVGRIAREKNLDLLLAAWSALGPRRGNAQLALVGRGPLADPIRRRHIPGVHVMGLLEGSALSTAYASADIFAFPSTTETFGNVLLEAMASGLPSVAAGAGGVSEFARHGDNAWLVAPGSADALTAGLERLLGDAPLRRRLTAGALRTAAERRWDLIDDGLLEDYRRAAGRKEMVRAA